MGPLLSPRVRSIALLGLITGCAGVRPLGESTARDRATRTFDGDAQAVLDAARLTLEARGYRVTQSNRAVGSFSAVRADGHGYDVTTETGQRDTRLTAMPFSPEPLLLGGDEGEDARWRALWRGVDGYLDAWREGPEWSYQTRTNTLDGAGCTFVPPMAWESLQFDVQRKRVWVRRTRTRQGTGATIFAAIERRPGSKLRALLGEAVVVTPGNPPLGVLDAVDAARPTGVVRVHDGVSTRTVRWYAQLSVSGAWRVAVLAVCGEGPDDCRADWAALQPTLRCTPTDAAVPP